MSTHPAGQPELGGPARSLLMLFHEGQTNLALTGEAEISWPESEFAFCLPVTASISRSAVGNQTIVSTHVSIQSEHTPKALAPLLQGTLHIQSIFSSTGALVAQYFPALTLTDVERTRLSFGKSAQESGQEIEANGVMATPLRDHEKALILRTFADEEENYSTGETLVMHRSEIVVDAKRLKFGSFRGQPFFEQSIGINKRSASFESLVIRFSAGPWWLLNYEARLYPS